MARLPSFKYLMLITCLTTAYGGCRRAPTEDDARGFYASRQSDLDAFDTALQEAIRHIPHFGVPPDTLPCLPPSPREGQPPVLNKLVADMHCTAQHIKMIESRDDGHRAFNDQTAGALIRDHGLLGLDVTYTMPGEPLTQALGNQGSAPPGHRSNAVRADQGITIGERRIGWGLYQDSSRNHEYRPGFEVLWHFQHQSARVKVRAFAWAGDR